jgi:hypothetical protein
MKKIRSLLLIFAVAAFTYSCGDAGFGFDVASELPVDAGEMVVPIPGTLLPVNIDPEVNTFTYDLDNVDGFADALDEIRNNASGAEVFLTGIAYEFTGIGDPGEDYEINNSIPIQEIRMEFIVTTTGTREILQIPLAGGILQNTPKTPLIITGVKNVIENELLNSNGNNVTTEFVFDMGTITTPSTPQQVDFDITIYFDVTLRVRDVNN